MPSFELAGGSVTGRDHRLVLKPNQDAYHFEQTEDLTIAIVSDGCGSGKKSQVGAEIGVRLLAQSIRAVIREHGWLSLEHVRHRALEVLRQLAQAMGGITPQLVIDYFLFTLVGVVLTKQEAIFFHLGDGIILIDDERITLGPFPNNEPPYLAYGLLETSLTRMTPERLSIQVARSMPLDSLRRFALLTDGGSELLRATSFDAFWEEDRIYSNPDVVRRRLATLNAELRREEHGPLIDDTTLIVGRRKKEVDHAGSHFEREADPPSTEAIDR